MLINPGQMNSSTCYYSSNLSTSNIRDVWLVFIIPCFTEIPIFYANSVDSDQMPHSGMSDLDVYCLLMSLLWNARLKWVLKIENHDINEF